MSDQFGVQTALRHNLDHLRQERALTGQRDTPLIRAGHQPSSTSSLNIFRRNLRASDSVPVAFLFLVKLIVNFLEVRTSRLHKPGETLGRSRPPPVGRDQRGQPVRVQLLHGTRSHIAATVRQTIRAHGTASVSTPCPRQISRDSTLSPVADHASRKVAVRAGTPPGPGRPPTPPPDRPRRTGAGRLQRIDAIEIQDTVE